MKRLKFSVDRRDEFGDGPSKKLRENGYIPGVIYGKDIDTIPIKVSEDKFREVMRKYGHNCIFRFDIPDVKEELIAIVKEIQLDYLSEGILHIDFMKILLDKPIVLEVPIIAVGIPVGVTKGGMLEQTLHELEIRSLPMEVPDSIKVDVSELDFGSSIHTGEITLPENVELVSNPELLVYTVSSPSVVEEKVLVEEEVVEGIPEEGEEEVRKVSEESDEERR